MMPRDTEIDSRVAALREAFDRSFAIAPAPATAPPESFLAIRLGSDAYVLRLSDAGGLFTNKKITPVPSPAPELLGIAGFRATALPVYDLGMLLGYPRASSPRWLVLASAAPVGFAFDAFEGYVQQSSVVTVRDTATATSDRHVRAIVHAEGAGRAVISLASVLDAVRARAARHGSGQDALQKER